MPIFFHQARIKTLAPSSPKCQNMVCISM